MRESTGEDMCGKQAADPPANDHTMTIYVGTQILDYQSLRCIGEMVCIGTL